MSKTTIPAGGIGADAIDATKIADDAISEEHIDPTAITASTEKSTLVAADKFLIADSAASNAIKYVQQSNLGSGGLVRLGGASATGVNVGDVSFDVFSATYNMYVCYYRINFIADSSRVWLKLRSGGSYTSSSEYKYALNGVNWSGTEAYRYTNSGVAQFDLTGGTASSDNANSSFGKVIFYLPYSSSHMTNISIEVHEQDESAVLTARSGAGVYQNNASLGGFGFMGSSQNLEEYDFQVFGVKQS